MHSEPNAAPVLVHAHLFKNAGTTFDWSLARHFGSQFCDHRDDAQMRGNPDYLKSFLLEHPQLRAVSSHWLPLPLPQMTERGLHPVIFLRDPIARIASVYAFERRQEVDHPGTRMAREGSLLEYVRWRLEAQTGPVLRNYQTRMLSGEYPGSGTEEQFERALSVLEAIPVVGLVERYRESIVLLEENLGQTFPGIDLAFQRQNVSDEKDRRDIAQRRRDLEAELGDLLAEVLDANRLDLQLYDLAQSRLQEAWEALDRREERLQQLDTRCEAASGV